MSTPCTTERVVGSHWLQTHANGNVKMAFMLAHDVRYITQFSPASNVAIVACHPNSATLFDTTDGPHSFLEAITLGLGRGSDMCNPAADVLWLGRRRAEVVICHTS
ncbi:hypothetical protein Hypma_010967 [Hypsizygus marmoreus]|uniref:Uncharacterized protein n=1 Tax=Hypsizygus marmoreus TaxID=39966 RepID=A0A369JT42_HYPMA|nr:hypothetical protein Hypma_010967 [Hypsizygus marmoreus]